MSLKKLMTWTENATYLRDNLFVVRSLPAYGVN